MFYTPVVAFAIIAATFSVGDYIALKTKGLISTFVTAMIVFILFGSVFKVLPPDLMDTSGLISVIPTFGMVLILTNLGSTLDLNALAQEWKTICVSLAAIAGIIILGLTLGQMLFEKEYALGALPTVAGGIVATMVVSDAANAAGRPEIAAYAAAILSVQTMVGLPIASVCLRKAAFDFIKQGKLNSSVVEDKKAINLKFVPDTPPSLDIATAHFARLAIVGALGQLAGTVTGINATIFYLLFGALAAATGIIEPNSLKKAGGDGVMLLATYAYVSVSFLTMSAGQFAGFLGPILGMLLIGAVGVGIFSVLVGLIFKWNPFLSIAVGISCMFGYPITYAVAMEVTNGVSLAKGFDDSQKENLRLYLLPKMLIAGVASVSVASVILAGFIAPRLFG